jgi:hypothetical protein
MELFGLFLLVSRDVSAAAEHSAGKKRAERGQLRKERERKEERPLEEREQYPLPNEAMRKNKK